jgi:hypothetical protein
VRNKDLVQLRRSFKAGHQENGFWRERASEDMQDQISESACRWSWCRCLEKAVRAPQPVKPARLSCRGRARREHTSFLTKQGEHPAPGTHPPHPAGLIFRVGRNNALSGIRNQGRPGARGAMRECQRAATFSRRILARSVVRGTPNSSAVRSRFQSCFCSASSINRRSYRSTLCSRSPSPRPFVFK